MQKTPIRYLKLPFLFEAKSLREELEIISNDLWVKHHYSINYEGEWTALSLYAEDGDPQNIFASSDIHIKLKETSLLKKCTYLRHIISHFHCPLLSVRLSRLTPGAEIKPHRDLRAGYEDNNFRLHIPIKTNPGVTFILDGEKIIMLPGECWY
ncbi:MAG: aspartyl/asparaginyl beta-hydroxylase domain-containing protein, partial [Bacteroidota bacterium]